MTSTCKTSLRDLRWIHTCCNKDILRKAGGKPSTWLPPGGLVERLQESDPAKTTQRDSEAINTPIQMNTLKIDSGPVRYDKLFPRCGIHVGATFVLDIHRPSAQQHRKEYKKSQRLQQNAKQTVELNN